MPLRRIVAASIMCLAASGLNAQTNRDYLANNTVLIIRHAEKPLNGRDLTPQGEARARAYTDYFQHFPIGSEVVAVDGLYAGADSDGSMRPRLTLEPLHQATGLPLHEDVGTKESPKLVKQLREQAHGTHPLVAWRHGQIPTLLEAFGASPAELFPNGKWPDDVFDWVVVLHFDGDGKLASQSLVREALTVHAP